MPAAAIVMSAPFAPFEPGTLAGPTPDLRLGDEALPRADASGETMDAELAAALDRLSADPGSDPTPAVLGLDIFGPGPAAESGRDEIIAADARVDPAADTELAYRVTRRPPLQASGLDAAEKPAHESRERRFRSRLHGARDAGGSARRGGRGDARVRSGQDDAAPEEPLRPFVRGRSAERRRTPSRYGRGDAPPPSACRTWGPSRRSHEPSSPTGRRSARGRSLTSN